MLESLKSHPRAQLALEILAFMALLLGSRPLLDAISWRYAGTMSLVLVMLAIAIHMYRRSIPASTLGLVPLSSLKSKLWLLPQFVFAFLAIGVAGVSTNLIGGALGFEIFTGQGFDPAERWGELRGNTPLFIGWLAVLWFAGPAEELFFRGYLMTRLITLLGSSRWATIGGIVISSLIFGAGHVYYQGLRGLFVTGMIGAALAVLFLLYRRNLWPLMAAHAAFNSMVFTGLYLGADF